MKTRRFLPWIAGLAFAACAGAQSFPTRTVTLVSPFPPGGSTDAIARIMAQRMGTSLGQTVVVENVTGAGGSIAVGKVVHSAPDGYTVGIGHLGTHVITGAVQELQYNALTDLDPVGMVASNPQIIVSKNDVPAKTLQDFVAWAKGKAAPVTSGTGGPGTGTFFITRRIMPRFCMSARTAWATPGYWTLTATSRPSGTCAR